MVSLPAPPPYGAGTLSDLVPSLLAAMGVDDLVDRLGVPRTAAAVVLLVDGLGWELLQEHAAAAPFLTAGVTRSPLHAGFPATTATSLASLGTGRPPGEHGIVGYAFDAGSGIGPVNALTWRSRVDDRDLREQFAPESAQPWPTAFELAVGRGVRVTLTAPRYQDGSGLTRAALRGAEFRRVHALGDLAAELAATPPGMLRYAYHGDLDALGHEHGPGSLAWRRQLTQVDRLVESVVSELPAGCLLAVTGDHGMVAVSEKVDVDTEPVLQQGVRLVSGEARVRHVYAVPGAAADVLGAWQRRLGDLAWVVSRDDAVGAGWFGPTVADIARDRIGDVVVAMRGSAVVVRSVGEPFEAGLRGHHGSLTSAEQLVPLLLFSR